MQIGQRLPLREPFLLGGQEFAVFTILGIVQIAIPLIFGELRWILHKPPGRLWRNILDFARQFG